MRLPYSIKFWINWLMHEDQNELFQTLFANFLTILFLLLITLALWPLGYWSVVFSFAKGYYFFWILLYVTAALLLLFQKLARVDLDSRFDAYVISALVVSGVLLLGWSVFAVKTVRAATITKPVWFIVMVYFIGFLSSYIAYGIVSSLYMGQIYRYTNLWVALGSYLVFCLVPVIGQLL